MAAGQYEIREFPPERKRIDVGDFLIDDRRFRDLTGWRPRVGLAEVCAARSNITAAIWRAII